MVRIGHLARFLLIALVLSLVAASCGDVDDSDTAETEDISRAAGTLADPNLTLVVTQLSSGFGNLSRAQQQTLQGVAENSATCTTETGPRARPLVSQVEVEVITVKDQCLRFRYEVANFGSFVDDLRSIRRGPDVIAASPLLLDYQLDQTTQTDQDTYQTTQTDQDTDVDRISTDLALQAIAGDVLTLRTTPTGSGVTIAVIDSGIDISHPSLAGVRVRRAPDSGTGDYVPSGHGTIAAAIMVAPLGTAGRGIVPGAELLDVPADLCHGDACGCEPCAEMTPAEALRWSADNGADIISMSFGYRPAPKPAWWQLLLDDDELDSAVETIEVALAYADAKGIAMVAAAGNCANGRSARCENADQFEIPAGHRAVIGVGASILGEDGEMLRAEYSTRQSYVELVAPGRLAVQTRTGESRLRNGTSYSTPFVTAALALLVGSDGPLAQQDDAGEVARRLLGESATDVEPAGRDVEFGHGQLHLERALLAAEDYVAKQAAEQSAVDGEP